MGHFLEDGLSRISGANHHDTFCPILQGLIAAFQNLDKPEGKTYSQQKNDLENCTHQIIGKGHTIQQYGNQDGMEQRRDKRTDDCTNKFCEACKAPHAVIHA